MAEFRISRLRYTWRNQWTTSTSYNKDDVVRYGGSTWVCVRQHTASAFQTDQDFLANPGDSAPTPAWIKMTDGYRWTGTWQQSTLYAPGDIVLYGGVVYLTITSNTSGTTFIENADKFAEYATTIGWTKDWSQNTRYGVGDLVRYNGIVYKCIAEHTSSSTADGLEVGNNDGEDDSTAELWEVYYEGVDFVGDWTIGIRYRLNDLVKYGGTILRVVTGHTAGANIDPAHFITEFPGNNYYGEWSADDYYAVGDVVRHGGYLFRSNENNNNVSPGLSLYDQPQPDDTWSLIAKGHDYKGNWSADADYKAGDVVRRGGYLYVALLDTTLTSGDGSSLDYLDASNWEIVIPGDNWRNSWISGSEYSLGDIVIYRGTVYRSNAQHISSSENFPGDNGSGFFYWDVVLQSGPNVALNAKGDLLTFDLQRENVGDGSTIGPTPVPIGPQDNTVTSTDGSVAYKRRELINKVRYVSADETTASDDMTDPERGKDPNKPYRTIRHACEEILKLGDDSVLHTIKVATGEYREVLPIVVPKGTAIEGNELRSVTVKPNLANSDLDATYQKTAIDRIISIMDNILNQTAVVASPNNETPQVVDTPVQLVSFSPKQYEFPEVEQGEIFQPTLPDSIVGDIQSLAEDIKQYIDFELLSTGSTPVVTGSNTISTTSYANVEARLVANEQFIADEVAAFVRLQYPAYTADLNIIRNTVKRYLRAFVQDLKYPGNYHSVEEGRYFRNLVNGSANDDMFYLRDTTGVRNLTTKDLDGSLNPPNVFELYRRPTGGAFMSLDPGWGPAHEACWIINRSPYIQNVTTFGNNCVGQKIDGSLHNGGNTSLVSNDFTQVISDGVGAWALNNGRAELVSVFTYYAQIGMFAEKGGVLRATNGNSSYGDFGAVADGNDPTETPKYAEVNNRTGQATVESAFAGEVNDEILILEYRNAGENYSTANYTFRGAGVNAQVVHEETRDNAVFEALIKNAPGDAGATEGGLGYFNQGNNAQQGNTTSLTLATNDDSTEAQILGLRLIITSGKGAGQYGYVTSYNPATKICNVLRESDDQPGWDHVIPGTPIQPALFTDNTYRFEPRPIFSHPGFTSTLVNLGQSENWSDIAYGETRETYNAVQGSAGTGETINVTPANATFNVVKNSRKYEVTLQSGGAGYEVDQEITLLGSEVGGEDGEHDVVITVTGVSDDSTNAITEFKFIGTANSGRFVAVARGGSAVSYSEDGDDWTIGTLPTSGEWNLVAANQGSHTYRFVAIRNNSATGAISQDGINWINRNLPVTGLWRGIIYGKADQGTGPEVVLVVAADGDKGIYSSDGGLTWSQTTLPDIGDSSFNEWVDVAYGKGKFVAVANSGNFAAVGQYNSITDTWTWESYIMDVIADSTTKDWKSITWGANKFLAVSGTGEISYSFDGEDWLSGGFMPTQDGSTPHNWTKVRYGQGVFFAVGDNGDRVIGADAPGDSISNFAATSESGILWETRILSQSANWTGVGFGNPDVTLGDSTTQSNSTGTWIAIASNLDHGNKVLTGARTQGRCIVEAGSIDHIRIWEPGSGYGQGTPTITIVDPNTTDPAYVEIRTGDAVLAQPSWINRGQGYRTSSTTVEVLGDGFADVIPNDQFVTISGLELIPGPGTQFRFRGASEFFTVQTSTLESTQDDGTITARFRVTPRLTLDYFLEHTSQTEIRERYSQVRITGHDFLDVGTGNFTETNYPVIYSSGAAFDYAPENEVQELNGGRVFYTSTDQNGNFRCGELFAVEQATGIVTISADFFDLGGLTELSLGGVRLGGSGTVVREFSTDPLFIQDSNNVVPTQRAIAAYLQNRLNVGGSDLLTASFIAGTVRVGPDRIDNVASLEVVIPVKVDYSGDQIGISGSILAQTMFFDSFNE